MIVKLATLKSIFDIWREVWPKIRMRVGREGERYIYLISLVDDVES